MVDRRIYAGYYRRYDGKVIYVVTMAKDADTDEDVVIWTPNVYSDKCAYYTMSKRSFFGCVFVDGVRQPKFKRQTQMRIAVSAIENFEEDGFVRPVRKANAYTEDGYDDWRRPSADTYHEYAKQVCEGYRAGPSMFCVSKRNGTSEYRGRISKSSRVTCSFCKTA